MMHTVATVTWLSEVNALRMKLAAEGIEIFIPDEFTVYTHPFLAGNSIGGIRVQVEEKDYERAREILAIPVPPHRPDRFQCPACHSDAVEYEGYSRRADFISILLLGLPLLWRKHHCNCTACRYRWKTN